MKAVLIIISILTLPLLAQAKLPLRELESQRQIVIVARAAIRDSSIPEIKKCGLKTDGLEEKLQRAKDNAKKSWSKLTIDKGDLPLLTKAIHNCAARVSCEVYDSFITSVKVAPAIENQVEPLKIDLDKNLQELKPEAYQAAMKSVKNPCGLLKAISK